MTLRHALRSLRRTPWYSVTVIGTIALSMALATTVFALADGVLFKPLPYKNAHELYAIGGPFSLVASVAEVRQWAAAVPDVRVAVYRSVVLNLGATADDSPTRLRVAKVGPGFFDVLGQQPMAGGFQPEHFQPSAGRVPTLLTYGLWHRLFGGSMSAIGQPFDLVGAVESDSGRAMTFVVAGVLPRDFTYPNASDQPDLILPLALTPAQESDRNSSIAGALVRIPDGMSPDAIRDRVDAVAQTQNFRDANADLRPASMAPDPHVSLTNVAVLKGLLGTAEYRSVFVAATVLVGLTCMNVVALGLARSRQRRRDLAVRRALGASRSQLLRQTFTEAMPLVAAGTAIGLLVAPWLVRIVMVLMDDRAAVLTTPEVGWRVAAFAALTSIVFVVTVVLMQLRSLSAASPLAAMGRGQSVTDRRGWWAPTLQGLQIALALVLTIGGTLMVGSVWWAWQQDLGFTPGEAVIVDVSLGGDAVADRAARFDTVLDQIRAQPGVRTVGFVSGPILRAAWAVPAIVRPASAGRRVREQWVGVGGETFAILGIRAIEGRLFTVDEQKSSAPVAVVSEQVARTFWPGQSAVGQVLQERGRSARVVTVIGVVRDARLAGPHDTSHGQIYAPVAGPGGSVLVLGSGRAQTTLESTLRAIRSVGAPVGVTHANTVANDLGEPLRRRTFAAWLYGAFAASSLLIVAVGLIGFVAMSTATRTREIGIRGALGATHARVIRLILREQLTAMTAGLLVGGIAASWAVSSLRRSMYGFSVHDGRLWAVAAATIVGVALIATLIPAWRAVRVNAVDALRAD